MIRDDQSNHVAAQTIEGVGAALILVGIAAWSVPAALVLAGVVLVLIAGGADHA